MANTVRPTKKQRELLTFIERFIGEHGYSPSYREIMTGLNYTSVATVALHINNLIKRGHLRKRDHSARSLEVTSPSEEPKPGATSDVVKSGEEKWLVEKVEHFFSEAETLGAIAQEQLDQLFVLVGALRVLGLDDAAESFAARLNELKHKVAEPIATE